MDTTLDGLLDRRVALEQPAQGYRVAVDTVLLASAVPTETGDQALDLGCGVGGALLCLACRVPGISVTGLELQPELVELCRRNIGRNAFDAEMQVMQGDATQLPDDLVNAFDHVFMNPPYHDETRHHVSADKIRRTANTEKEGDLALWIAAAAKALRYKGRFTLIHRADRLSEISAHMGEFFGHIDILPIAPKPDAPPRRVILRGMKGAQPSVRQYKSFVLHRPDGGYADAAERILRHAKMMDFIE